MTDLRPGEPLSEPDRLILAAATGTRALTAVELRRILEHVAHVEFNPTAREQAKGRLTGIIWQGRAIVSTDMLSPAEVHYLAHVIVGREWPQWSQPPTLPEYIESIRQVIGDQTSGVFTNRYRGAWGLAVVRESRELRGEGGHEWVLIQYRVGWGHWVTAHQLADGLDALRKPQWSDIRWLRRPSGSSGQP